MNAALFIMASNKLRASFSFIEFTVIKHFILVVFGRLEI